MDRELPLSLWGGCASKQQAADRRADIQAGKSMQSVMQSTRSREARGMQVTCLGENFFFPLGRSQGKEARLRGDQKSEVGLLGRSPNNTKPDQVWAG